MDAMREILLIFFAECEENLEAAQDSLEALRARPDDMETVNTIFRAVHSIKGGAAAFGLSDLVDFAHAFESTLDLLRTGRLATSADVVATLVSSADLLSDLVAAARDERAADRDAIAARIEGLAALGGDPSAARETAPDGEPSIRRPAWAMAPEMEDGEAEAEEVETSEALPDAGWGDPERRPAWATAAPEVAAVTVHHLHFRPRASLLERGREPARLLREIGELGAAEVRCDVSAIPTLDELDASAAYLSWEIEVLGATSEDALREVFDFVDQDCDLTIKAGVSPEEGEAARTPMPAPVAILAPKLAPADMPNPAPEPATGPGEATLARATVRVDLDRVDHLINLVGELLINQAMLSQSVIDSGLAASSVIALELEGFRHLTHQIQESVLAIRAQPLKPLFQRMSRIAREAAAATGKTVEFATEGEMTEVDKTVIERLAEPLTHMIRNAIDHGLETAETRVAGGKPGEGTVRLSAAHRSGRVLIEIADDGAGIDRERVLRIATEKRLVPAEAALSDVEIDNLLFLPGFSTARTVSDLSGRGVGMDVVKRAITNLGGRISIASQPGAGTTFGISLPLTLAILDGMIVGVGEETLVVPLSAIVEMLKPGPGEIHPLGAGETVVQVRGEFVPIIDVAARLGIAGPPRGGRGGVMLLIETSAGERRALIVDAIQDQRQVVIKGLAESCGAVPGIAAATILGNGRVALILDTDAIVADAGRGDPISRADRIVA